eukprot:6715035-Prymnesium_polylepis.2
MTCLLAVRSTKAGTAGPHPRRLGQEKGGFIHCRHANSCRYFTPACTPRFARCACANERHGGEQDE